MALSFYANVLGIRINAKELILEFGAQFPEAGQEPVLTPANAEIRVILPSEAAENIAAMLLKVATSQREQAEPPNRPK